MNRFLSLNQAGFALIIELAMVAVILLGIGGVGYVAYKARQRTTAISIHGTIKQNDCSKAGVGCLEYTVSTDSGKGVGVVGPADVRPYIGKTVTIKGKPTSTTPVESISAVNIQADPTPVISKGTLSIEVFCGSLNYEEPCASSISIENHGSASGNLDTYTPTDASGHLLVSLPAGKYDVTPESKPNYPVFAPPISNPVIITADSTTVVTINYHDLTK